MGNDANSACRICSLNFARTVTYVKEGDERNVDLYIFESNTKNLSGEESLSQKYSSESCPHEFDITNDENLEVLLSPPTSFSVDSLSSKHINLYGEGSIMKERSFKERTQIGREISKLHGTFSLSDIVCSEDDDITSTISIKREGMNDEAEEDKSLNLKSGLESLRVRLPESIQSTAAISTHSNRRISFSLNQQSSSSFQPEVEGPRSPSSQMMSQVLTHSDPRQNPCFSEEKCPKDKFNTGTNNLRVNRFGSPNEISRSNTGKSEENSKIINKLDSGEGTTSCGSLRYFPYQVTHSEYSTCLPNRVNDPARSKLKKPLDSPISQIRDFSCDLSDGYDSAELVTGSVPDCNDMGSLTLCKREVRSLLVPSLNNWRVEGWSDKDKVAELYRENKSESESVELDDYYFTNVLPFSNNNHGYHEVEDREEEYSDGSIVSDLSLLPVLQSVTF